MNREADHIDTAMERRMDEINKDYPIGELDRYLRKCVERPVQPIERSLRPIRRVFMTTLDCGLMGEQPISIIYLRYGDKAEIESVAMEGFKITDKLSERTLQMLTGDIQESVES